jgi:hypothetical protein
MTERQEPVDVVNHLARVSYGNTPPRQAHFIWKRQKEKDSAIEALVAQGHSQTTALEIYQYKATIVSQRLINKMLKAKMLYYREKLRCAEETLLQSSKEQPSKRESSKEQSSKKHGYNLRRKNLVTL